MCGDYGEPQPHNLVKPQLLRNRAIALIKWTVYPPGNCPTQVEDCPTQAKSGLEWATLRFMEGLGGRLNLCGSCDIFFTLHKWQKYVYSKGRFVVAQFPRITNRNRNHHMRY